jgi:hypothetical protein
MTPPMQISFREVFSRQNDKREGGWVLNARYDDNFIWTIIADVN